MTVKPKEPWLKITFDPTLPGTVKVLVSGHKRPVTLRGRWVVFDRNFGYKSEGASWRGVPARPVFAADTFEECDAYISNSERRTTNEPT